MKPDIKAIVFKLLIPLLVCAVVFGIFYFGGDGFQTFGVAAMDSTTTALKYVLGVMAFISLGVLVNRFVRFVIFEGIIASATGVPVPKLLTQISSVVIYIITIAACANIIFHQDLQILWAASGVAGLVLGMALKELLQDIFAGIALNLDRAVRIGDFVQVHRSGDDKIVGQVTEINWRSTQIRNSQGDYVNFPNSKFSACTITNFSLSDTSGSTVHLVLDARIPPQRVTRILQAATLDALHEVHGSLADLPLVGIKAIKPEGVEYTLNFQAPYPLIAEASWKIQQAVLHHMTRAGLKPSGAMHTKEGSEQGFALPDETQLIRLLGAAVLTTQLESSDLHCLLRHAHMIDVSPGRALVHVGEAGNALYLVLEGLLRIDSARVSSAKSENLKLHRPGDIFDARATLLGSVHKNTVRAQTPCLILQIEPEGWRELFSLRPASAWAVAQNLLTIDTAKGKPTESIDDIMRQIQQLFSIPLIGTDA